MTRGEPKESILRRYLADVVAAEQSSEARLNEMSGEGDHSAARLLFAQHADETRSQCQRLRARLDALGGSPSGLKAALAHLSALIPKTAHMGHDDSEIATQNLIFGYALEHEEIAMYEALASTAASAGDLQTEQLARDIQKEERHAAEMIWHLIASSAQESYGKISEAA
jgi:ferritin-like metal-binding protein YciE